ncbi:MAG: biotin transporter BioY [Planctomycetes bacterium]|nr:biotin transporter BioY [Planctomycetota bacterium]MBI3834467.1 biotin transporter BioY [Planctomycetota bacterium]
MSGVPIQSSVSSDVAGFLKPVASRLSARTWLLQVLAFSALTALAAQVRVPVPGNPVPMTLQSLSVLLAGLMLTPTQAAGAMLLYLGAGTFGAPVFATHSHGVWGPTGGYLVGFVVAAAFISLCKGRSPGVIRRTLAAGVGLGALFACGITWLSMWTGGSAKSAAMLGFAPFAVKGIVEVGVAVVASSSVLRLRGRNQESAIGKA